MSPLILISYILVSTFTALRLAFGICLADDGHAGDPFVSDTISAHCLGGDAVPNHAAFGWRPLVDVFVSFAQFKNLQVQLENIEFLVRATF